MKLKYDQSTARQDVLRLGVARNGNRQEKRTARKEESQEKRSARENAKRAGETRRKKARTLG